MNKENLSFITIATRSFLPQVALLAKSLKQHHPENRLFCYLVEDNVNESDFYNSLFDILSIKELSLPGGPKFLFQYTPFELCCAIKPYAIKNHLIRYNKDVVVYLDSDMYVYTPFKNIIEQSFQDSAVLFCPHILRSDNKHNYNTFRRVGSYNAGFMAFKNQSNAIEVLDWLQDRCCSDCYVDVYGGVFVDQGWIDIAISLFPSISILRDPGINVGHWNIHEKIFSNVSGRIMVDNNTPLSLFHFSGFTEHRLSKHLDTRLFPDGIPDIIQRLSHEYANQLKDICTNWPVPDIEYSYGHYTDNSPITPTMREIIRLRLVETDNPFKDMGKIQAFQANKNPDEILNNRIDYCITNYPHLLKHYNELDNKIKRLDRHFVLGRIWRFWRKYINPAI